MAVETRPELVGKRFLCLGGEEPPESGRWRAGVIRAVSQRDSHSPELAVYVEFDDLEWEKREWVKVYEDFATFLVEYQLVWAKRKDPSQTQGSKIKQIQWPALTFKPLVGKSVYNSITAVEFLVDKQLDFITEDSAFQPYQDDVDSLNPVLRDNPQLHEEVKAWVKEQKVQEIFMQGPYSLNGYRVRVYRQDSATQWFTGIITHHDLFTRTMVVMNDQVLEPQNVDPSMVQMTFLDDVVHSLLKGENIGITSRRRSRSNQNSNTVHGHYTRAQANSPRPAMNSQTAAPKQNSHQHQQQRNTRPNKRKGSDSSMPDEEKMKDERYDYISRGENPKTKNKHFLSKRRKPEEDEKKLNMKRLRTDNISDYSESSDSEISNKRLTDSSSEQNSENELKSKNTSKINGEEGKSQPTEGVEQTLTDRRSPWDEVQEDKNHEETERLKSSVLDQPEKSSLHAGEQPTPYEQNAKDAHALECNAEKHHTAELKNEQFLPRPPTPKCVVDVTNKNNSEKENQDNAASTFGLQTVQKIESHSSDLKQQFANANFLEARKQEADQSWVSGVVKTDLIQPGVVKALPVNEHLNSEKEKVQYGSFMSSLNVASLAEESKLRKQSPAPDSVKSKSSASVDHPKTKSPDVKPKFTQSSDTVKSKYPNGTHAYSGLGLPSSKWVHPETPVNAEASLRRNTPSPWLHQPTPVTSADSLGLLSHIPVRPSSADPLRPLKLTTHSSPPLSKSIVEHRKEELERKAFVEPLRSVTTAPVKTELEQSRTQAAKESHMHRHFADPMLNQLPRPPQETGERLSKYKEEHRRILQESIEVAPFTAKIKALEGERENYSRVTSLSSSPKSHSVKYDKDAERSVSELYKMKHSVPQSLPQSNYFTTLSNSVVNEPPRSYPSKEASGTYVDKQTNCPSTAASPQALPSYISSLSKPPPLIKHQPESEGSTSKVPEQLSQSVQSHSVNSFRSDSRSPTQLSISSSNTLRSMPALHRAPVFHPPVHQNLEKKESSYSSLSPPTLTPVQPVNAGGGGKIQELQKPPTLVPEPKEAQTVYKGTSEQNVSEMWKSNNAPNNEKVDWHVERMSGKSQSATASVIVRPPSSTKYDSVAVVQPASKDRASERSSAVTNQADCLKTAEARETGRVILPNMNSDSARTQYEKKFPAVSQGSIPRAATPTTTIICSTKTDVTTSAATTTSVSSQGSSEVTYSLSSTVLACTTLECPASRAGSQAVAQAQECKVSTPAPVTPAAGSTGCAAQPSSGFSTSTDFVHLKKHKAALAAAQFKSSNTSEAESNSVKNQTFSTSLSLDSGIVCNTINKANSVGSGQTSQTSQPNYHTKLKKAWLTRHSEEDKNTNKKENSGNSVSEIIKPCTVNLIASTSNDLQNNIDSKILADKFVKEEKHPRRKGKRTYESGSESGDSDESESKSEQRTKRQPKPTYKKKQNDLQKKKGDTEEEVKPNGVLSRSAKEKSKLKLQSSSNSTGIPRSVLKDWRKVKKLKQTGESFLQDDSCSEIGPNLQKCRECRLIRSKKGEEPTHSPVFCRFYYFRRLSFSKNGVVRIDGFSSPDQYDDEALSLWTHENYDDDELDLETSKYILDIIGDKFCQLVTSEKTAMSWVKKDAKIAWKRAVRGVREMCDACEATLFNIHWVCQKCGFVVCLDCYKAKERKSSRDKELYAWMKCVKGQPHDHKHLMPTQIIPGSVLTDLLDAMHNIREKFEIKSHCQCTSKQSTQTGKLPAMNGVSQVLQNVLNHSNKISLCMPESQQQNTPQKSEANGNTSPRSDVSTDSKLTPPESQSPLHWLADLAEQKAREEKKENKECPSGKHSKEEKDQDNLESQNCKNSPPASQNNEQGSTLRDLLTTTAGKLRLGSTDAGIAFAPVYSTGTASGKSGRTMPNILDDIIASVVENKIPPNRAPKINVKSEIKDEPKDDKKCIQDDCSKRYSDIQYSWICDKHVLWLRDHKNSNNWKLFKECWKQGRPVLVSGMHKKMNFSLWKAESISLDFGNQQADILNCKDSIISNTNVKEFWDGFEDVSKRQKVKNGETALLKLKDWPSGEDFKAMMPARYEDLLKSLPLPEYCSPEGKLNLASHLPGFFVRPDLGPRLCSAYGVAATKDHDIGTTNLHIEVSDVVNILVYVGIAKGNGVLSKSGVLKKLEEEDLDDLLRKRLKDSSELPGALWHIYAGKDADKIREFLQKIAKEQGLEVLPEHDPIRDQSWYVNRKLRQRLFEEYGVKTCTVIQFLGDAIILPAGALHQVQNFHSCVQVTEDFVSPEHLVQSFHLTQELRLSKEEINYDDKLQVKNILYHAVKEMVRALKIHEGEMEDMDEN
ncbi:probable JmjC domain-containing histone demethylation protein 2C isoform X4 [Neopelma chrysocephalum]|uniref:probable JmjC domain-containing histone demethylation protein 2C isoform X4 n=1 Tax=Neopelma chrysocephalum TaxID=114329 RepID=UPI000FCD1C7D|nr:probable JmjC domain-containing histone demethylation protein 2C isoform X4 [Neopelma chrysocephalum]